MAVVYVAKHTATGRYYVGKANNYQQRLREHKSRASRKKTKFACALNCYGFDAFEWLVVEEDLSEDEAYRREVSWIQVLESHLDDRGFNLRTEEGGTHCLNEEVRQRISDSLRGRKASPETRAKLSAVHKGRKKGPWTAERKARAARAAKERCEKGILPMLGRQHSEETRLKMKGPRASMKARWADPEWRERMLASRRASRAQSE